MVGRFITTPEVEFPLPHLWFLATPLLQCGEGIAETRKFTGTNALLEPEDDLAMAIHAFTHFSYLYSMKSIVFVDLQGVSSVFSLICLLEPTLPCYRAS